MCLLLAEDEYQAPPLTAPVIAQGIDEVNIRRLLLERHGIEIGAGFGPLAGKIWRIGLMGESSKGTHVLTLLQALESLLQQHGLKFEIGSSLMSAQKVLPRG